MNGGRGKGLRTEDVMRRVRRGCASGTAAALSCLAEASKALTARESGRLRRSCRVSLSPDGLSGTVSYDTPYAVAQHENTGLAHPRGGRAKYLQAACEDRAVAERMLREAARETGRRLK